MTNGFVTPAQFNQAIETVVGLVIDHLNKHPETTPDQSFALGLLSGALHKMKEEEQ